MEGSLRSRLRSRWLAGLLLLAWLAPVVAPHAAGDDVLCAPSSEAEDLLRLQPNADVAGPHHCVICHSIRSFRSALADCGPASGTLTPEHSVPVYEMGRHREPAFACVPARAPPA